MAGEDILIRLGVAGVDQVEAAMKTASNAIGGMVSGAKNMFTKMVDDAKLASAAFALAFGKIANDAINVTADFERVGIMSKYLTKSTEEAHKFTQAIVALGLATPFSTKQISELGVYTLGQFRGNVDLTIKGMNALTNATSATGGGIQELDGITRAITQTFIKGKPSLEELNRQMANANIPALRVLSEHLADGTVKLKGYTDAVVSTGGPTKKMTTAFKSASDKLPILEMSLKKAQAGLEAYNKKSNKAVDTTLSHEIAVKRAQQALDKAKGSVDNYNAALGSKTTVTAFHKSTEEIMSDLQDVASMGVTGKDTAIAFLEALELEYAGANKVVLSTFQGMRQNVTDIVQIITASFMGMDKNLEIRKGSIFYYLKQGLQAFVDYLLANKDKFSAWADDLLKNKTAILAIAGAITGMLIPVLTVFISKFTPLGKLGLIFTVLGIAIGLLIEKLGGMQVVGNKVKGTIEDIKTAFQILIDVARGWDPGALMDDATWNKWKGFAGVLENIKTKAEEAFKAIKKEVMDFGRELVGIPASLGQMDWSVLKENLDRQFVQPFRDAISKIRTDMAEWVTGGLKIPTPSAEEMVLWDKFREIMKTIGDAFRNIGEAFTTSLGPAWESFQTSLTKMMPLLQQWADIFAVIGPPILQVLTLILGAFVVTIIGILALLGGLISGIANALGSIILGVTQFVTGFVQIFTGLFTILGALITPDSAQGQKIIEGFRMIWQGVKNIFEGFKNTIFETTKKFIEGVIKFFQELYDKIIGKSIIPDLINGITKAFESLPGKATGWGRDLINNWITGIKEAVKNAPAGIAAKAKEWLGIYQHGGIVPGPIGSPMPVIAHGGERIVPRSGVEGGGGGGGITINITGSFVIDDDSRIQQLADTISKMLGRQNELYKYGVG